MREADPSPTAAAEPGDPGPPPEDLVGYLGLPLQAHAIALVRSGCTTRSALLALSPEDLRYTPAVGGARCKAIARRVAEWGDRLAEEQPRPRGPPRNSAIPLTIPANSPLGEDHAPLPNPADEALIEAAARSTWPEEHGAPDLDHLAALRRRLRTEGRRSIEALVAG